MVALSLKFLKQPVGNRTLFNLLTTYAMLVGAATVALLYMPDIPFFLGLASLALIIRVRLKSRGVAAMPEEERAETVAESRRRSMEWFA